MTKSERRPFAPAYTAREADAVELVDGSFGDAERWRAAIRDAGTFHDGARQALHAQNARGPDTEGRRASLRAIDEQGTVAVVTGQQPGLFGGALLSYLKAASAVTLARRVEREHGVRCVPVFWVQSEDHDFDEIAEHAWLSASRELGAARLAGAPPIDRQTPTQPPPDHQARISLEHRVLGDDVGRCLDELQAGLSGTPHADAVIGAVRRAYAPDRGIAEAFAALVAELFADDGLLVLRPRSPAMARALSPLHVQCVERMDDIERALAERAAELERRGFGVQVPVREGTALSFFHPDGALGPRYRLARASDDDRLSLAGRDETFPLRDVLDAAEREPLRFSTSALLRPIAQDTLLPTVAYLGGPSELAYFAQLPPLYEAFGMRAPVIVPRLSARWLDAQARELLAGQPADEATLADDGPIARELGSEVAGIDFAGLAGRLERAVHGELDAVRPALEALDPGLAKACDKTSSTARDAADKLVRRATRAALSQAPEARARLERLRAMLRPRGVPQERVLGWTSIAARLGLHRLREIVLGFDPLEPGTRDIAGE